MALPDFLIIGAMKCGTTTLQAQLAAQDGIFMTDPKEPNFFSDDAVYSHGLEWYEQLFMNAPAGSLKGEASTHYTKLPTHPASLARLSAALPAPKLIYLIRNPISRAVSHYIHEWTQGVISDDIETAFVRHPELVSYSCYGMQIAPYVEAFGAGNIFLSSLEVMNRSPQALLNRVGAFLGCAGTLSWQDERAKMNVSAERFRRLPLQGLLVDNAVATALRRSLVPKSLRDRIRQGRQMTIRPELTQSLTSRLERVFAEDHARLAALFPGNSDILSSYPFLAVVGAGESSGGH